MKCFYHNADLDGHCSGAIVKYVYPECKLIGIDYGQDFPWDDIAYGETIFIVDFSLQPYSLMEKLDKLNLGFTWIDHHKSAIEEYNRNPLQYTIATLVEGTGSCQLVWESLLDKKLPRSVWLLAQYDVWDHSDPETLPFQYGMRLEAAHPNDTEFWAGIFNKFPKDILDKGYTVLDYVKSENQKYISTCGFEVELDDLHCIAANKQLTNSQLFDTVWDPNKYHAMLTFGWRRGNWHISLYSTRKDVDVSIIAKNRGGGGHKGAAGFQCTILPFELEVKDEN